MAELSPITQAVLDAFRSSHTGQGCLAAALRAAAIYCKRDKLILLTVAEELEGLFRPATAEDNEENPNP